MGVGGRGETEMVTPKINFRNKIVNYKLINSLNSLKVKKVILSLIILGIN